VMAPMCMNMATDGFASDWHVIHYTTRAMGGVGLIIQEATAVSPEGRIAPHDLGIWSDDHIAGLKSIVDHVHEVGGKIGIQISHAGRKANLESKKIFAPSPILFSEDYVIPEMLTESEIQRIQNDFMTATKRALIAGYDMIELHGAHGYLINQFISPLSNKREDNYGGSIENRSRFLKEVLETVHHVWPSEKPVFLRISANEYDEKGNTIAALAELINGVIAIGIDVIDVSSGGIIPKNIITYPGYQLEIGNQIRTLTSTPTIQGGLITEPQMASEIILNNRSELVYLGRELLRNPYWVLQAANILGSDFPWPVQYERSRIVRKFGS